MADHEIHVPFGPDRTNGAGIEPIEAETPAAEGARDPFGEPSREAAPSRSEGYRSVAAMAPAPAPAQVPAVEPMPLPEEYTNDDDQYPTSGLTEEEALAKGVDPMQLSILALKDSIGQGRELKAREKDRQELADALAADHEELADRENILENYHALVAEQDAIINNSTQQREAEKAEMAQLTVALEETESALERMRNYHAEQIQPFETQLGQTRANAEQAKNDERSRKSELAAAEKELSRADDNDANTMAVARHQQTKAAYEDARRRSELAKENLAQVQRSYDDTKSQFDAAEAPLVRKVEDVTARIEALKVSTNQLAEDISAARKRRQYCDNVYQYPEETTKMRREVEVAEATARKMDEENDRLRKQLEASKKKALRAKIAIAIVIILVIVIVAAFVIVGNR